MCRRLVGGTVLEIRSVNSLKGEDTPEPLFVPLKSRPLYP